MLKFDVFYIYDKDNLKMLDIFLFLFYYNSKINYILKVILTYLT